MWGADSNTVTVATIVNNVNTNRQNLQKDWKEFTINDSDYAGDTDSAFKWLCFHFGWDVSKI